jgi:hypothetical protein
MILGSVFIKVEVPVVETQTRESRFRSSSSGCRVVVYTTPCNSFRLSRAKKAQWYNDPSPEYIFREKPKDPLVIHTHFTLYVTVAG